MTRVEQNPKDAPLSRRRMLGLAVAGASALADKRLPKEKLLITDYNPVTDKEATLARLQAIVSGERAATHRELFEVIADTFASSFEHGDWHEADDAYHKTDTHGIFVGYYRSQDSENEYLENAYLEVHPTDFSDSTVIEFHRLDSGRIEAVNLDPETDVETPVQVNPNKGKILAKFLLEGLKTPLI